MTGVQTCALPISHPENYLFSSSKKLFSGSKYPTKYIFNFENRSTAHGDLQKELVVTCAKRLAKITSCDGKCSGTISGKAFNNA